MKTIIKIFLLFVMISLLPARGGFEQEVISARNVFAFDLMNRLSQSHRGENIVLSPISIHLALTIAVNGAGGQTKDQMLSTLGIEDTKPVNDYNKAYLRSMTEQDYEDLFLIANSMWLSLDFGASPAFKKDMKHYYDAEISRVDFGDRGTKDEINDWISQKTMGKIPQMLEATSPLDVLYIINAVYFLGSWQTQFDTSKTQTDIFYTHSGNAIEVEMMNKTDDIHHFAGDDLTAISLPFGHSGDFSMVLIMPDEDIYAFASDFDNHNYSRIREQFAKQEVHIALPKFDLRFKTKLCAILKDMGMPDAFDTYKADFSGLSPDEGLFISLVLHEATITVDEKGAEASAATVIQFDRSSPEPQMPITVRFDKPFIMTITENRTGTILFAGIINKPKGE